MTAWTSCHSPPERSVPLFCVNRALGADAGSADRLWSARDASALAPANGYGVGGPWNAGVATPYGGVSLSEAGALPWPMAAARSRAAPKRSFAGEALAARPGPLPDPPYQPACRSDFVNGHLRPPLKNPAEHVANVEDEKTTPRLNRV